MEPGRIGGLGLSVGGETFLQAAAHNDDVQAVVSEGASIRSVGELAAFPAPIGSSPSTAGSPSARPLLGRRPAPAPDRPRGADRAAGDVPDLLHEGTAGEEHRSNRAFYRVAGEPKPIWEIPESGHVGGIDARPRKYERRVTGFFDQALLG